MSAGTARRFGESRRGSDWTPAPIRRVAETHVASAAGFALANLHRASVVQEWAADMGRRYPTHYDRVSAEAALWDALGRLRVFVAPTGDTDALIRAALAPLLVDGLPTPGTVALNGDMDAVVEALHLTVQALLTPVGGDAA